MLNSEEAVEACTVVQLPYQSPTRIQGLQVFAVFAELHVPARHEVQVMDAVELHFPAIQGLQVFARMEEGRISLPTRSVPRKLTWPFTLRELGG